MTVLPLGIGTDCPGPLRLVLFIGTRQMRFVILFITS
jgi:hypothetical protein